MQWPYPDTGALQLRHGRAKARALRDFHLGRKGFDLERRCDVPGGVTTGAEHDEQYECEKGFQSGAR